MFKKRGPYDREPTTLLEPMSRSLDDRGPSGGAQVSAYSRTQAPPENRTYPLREKGPNVSPYRTPAQAYPRQYEESQPSIAEEEGEFFSKPSHTPTKVELEQPEAILGESIKVKGELVFEKFLRIDGEFEGELLSQGKLHIGPTGTVRSNIHLREAVVEGTLEGNIVVRDRLELRGNAKIIGDIQARLLSIDEGVTIEGQVRVGPIGGAEK
ncbi:MAG: polymer-forming cytoskeletal protein [Parachlamydiales bacterium]